MAADPQPTPAESKQSSWSDQRLVSACLKGDEAAWATLIDRYKNLIFSIPIKHGLSREDAADVFQTVCVDFLRELPRLREVKALPKWLIQITAHKCTHREREEARFVTAEPEHLENLSPRAVPTQELLAESEREQALRGAIATLPPRCRELVHMLFYENPPRPYAEIAGQLRLAVGSIGFIRYRCLRKLRSALAKAGFE